MRRIFFISVGMLIFLPQSILAAEIVLLPESLPHNPGEMVAVSVYVNTLTSANAVELALTYDPEKLTFEQFSDGASVIDFWVTRPQPKDGQVIISGITPGGFLGGQQLLMTAFFTVKSSGTTTFQIQTARVLAHDGKGTDLPVSTTPLTLQLAADAPNSDVQPFSTADSDPPEYFTPVVFSHPDVADGKQLLAFETTDGGVGGVRFYVREYRFPFLAPFTPWREATSPYVLQDQTKQSVVAVRAVDAVGNERILYLPAEQPPELQGIFLSGILLLVFLFFLVRTTMRYWRVRKTTV